MADIVKINHAKAFASPRWLFETVVGGVLQRYSSEDLAINIYAHFGKVHFGVTHYGLTDPVTAPSADYGVAEYGGAEYGV